MDNLELWGRHILVVLAVFVAAYLIQRVVAFLLRQYVSSRLGPAHSMLLSRAVTGGLWLLALLMVLREFEINLGVFLGAAGIATVALGFAAQTSASNLISGVFLLGDRAFAVGDMIRIDSTTGEVVAVDQLSIKLRTPDNLMVRIPNETLIKASITNLTRWPIRRLDIPLVVDLATDLAELKTILLGVAAANPLCMVEPKPMVTFVELNESGIKVQFSVWLERKNLADVGIAVVNAVLRSLETAQIEIGAPRRAQAGPGVRTDALRQAAEESF